MTRFKAWYGRREYAVTAAYLGLVVLLPALFLPAVRFERLGAVSDYSILSSIVELIGAGSYLVAIVIFIFSIVFPVAKLGLVLILSLGRLGVGRRAVAGILLLVGKYSMLDVFVIALLIVAFKLGDLIRAEIDYGLYLFIVGIMFSTVANLMLLASLEPDPAAGESGEAMSAPEDPSGMPSVRPGITSLIVLILVPIALGLVGAGLYFTASPGTVTSVLVQRLPGVDITIMSAPDTPDYAVQLTFENGEVYRSPSKPDTPIGNGIVFDIPDVELALLREVSLWDDNSLAISDVKLRVMPDEIVDRVRTGEVRVIEGQRMRFELRGEPAWQTTWSFVLIAIAAVWLVMGAGVWLFRFARG